MESQIGPSELRAGQLSPQNRKNSILIKHWSFAVEKESEGRKKSSLLLV